MRDRDASSWVRYEISKLEVLDGDLSWRERNDKEGDPTGSAFSGIVSIVSRRGCNLTNSSAMSADICHVERSELLVPRRSRKCFIHVNGSARSRSACTRGSTFEYQRTIWVGERGPEFELREEKSKLYLRPSCCRVISAFFSVLCFTDCRIRASLSAHKTADISSRSQAARA